MVAKANMIVLTSYNNHKIMLYSLIGISIQYKSRELKTIENWTNNKIEYRTLPIPVYIHYAYY